MRRSFVPASALVAAIILACVVCVPAAVSSEDWAALSKRLGDRCGKTAQGIRDMTIAMEMVTPSSGGALVTKSTLYEKGDRFRAEVSMSGADMPKEMAGMNTVVIGDGANVWMVNPMTGKMQLPAGEGDKYRGQWRCGDYLPLKAEIAGAEAVNGFDCFILLVKDEHADNAKLWIDKKSLNLIKTESRPREGKAVITLFSDFRKAAGDWELAYKTEIFSGRDLVSTLVIKSVAVNKGLQDDLFDADALPGKGKGVMDMMKQFKKQAEDGGK